MFCCGYFKKEKPKVRSVKDTVMEEYACLVREEKQDLDLTPAPMCILLAIDQLSGKIPEINNETIKKIAKTTINLAEIRALLKVDIDDIKLLSQAIELFYKFKKEFIHDYVHYLDRKKALNPQLTLDYYYDFYDISSETVKIAPPFMTCFVEILQRMEKLEGELRLEHADGVRLNK